VVTFALVHDLDPELLGALLAIAGGSFIYIAASDLVPESHRSRGLPASIALCLGVLVAMAAGFFTHAH
jgi:ZIP family zinc transporter/zinc and cadmium transporter